MTMHGAPLKAWSFSRWDTYEECPQKMDYKFIAKIPDPAGSAAMENGDAVHNAVAAFLRGDAEGPVPGWTYFEKLLCELRSLEPLVEQEWGFTARWLVTGWFSADTWLRSKLDVALIYPEDNSADVVDFKTGKPNDRKMPTQAELYALSVFRRYPFVQNVTVRFWFLDLAQEGKEVVFRFMKAMEQPLIEKWTRRAEKLLNDSILAPKPGNHCKWCPFAKSKNGPCKYG